MSDLESGHVAALLRSTPARRCESRKAGTGGYRCVLVERHPGIHCNWNSRRRWNDADEIHPRPVGRDVDAAMVAARRVIERVAAEHATTPDELVGRSRERWIIEPRRQAMATIRATTCLSYPEIGRLFSRHHATVIEAIRGAAT